MPEKITAFMYKELLGMADKRRREAKQQALESLSEALTKVSEPIFNTIKRDKIMKIELSATNTYSPIRTSINYDYVDEITKHIKEAQKPVLAKYDKKCAEIDAAYDRWRLGIIQGKKPVLPTF